MKNKLTFNILIVAIFTLTLLCTCKKRTKCESLAIDDQDFSFRLIDTNTGESIIALWGTIYESEKVSLVKEDDTLPASLYKSDSGRFTFTIEDSNDYPLNEDIHKVFYLKLPDLQGIPDRDIDTITFNYQIQFDEDNCPKKDYKFFDVYYNDSLYHTGLYKDYIEFSKK
ncbi:MAG: hypothetical protein AB8F94_01795 [Saprospiraceae bacterium]